MQCYTRSTWGCKGAGRNRPQQGRRSCIVGQEGHTPTHKSARTRERWTCCLLLSELQGGFTRPTTVPPLLPHAYAVVPKNRSPKSPRPGRMYFFSLSPSSTAAVTIRTPARQNHTQRSGSLTHARIHTLRAARNAEFAPGCAVVTASRPSGQATTLMNVMLVSGTPWSSSTYGGKHTKHSRTHQRAYVALSPLGAKTQAHNALESRS